ncbi:hypothetical protein GWO43_20950 [candidate division KSB1 bacterium]|nr:hypothetical protein [candidate division KSB1 bacterium]NIR70264.1 hypothetical protein [candidate division KSB1 bacterium]NIS26535.1 hypothetical protein [candidate division KSB1 bacterium]NIT73297.1 hypothetical protein [candidate division KSB1 bacterium]NIU23921.1 hypothetical protein [candidate division KSB1 bacterium]
MKPLTLKLKMILTLTLAFALYFNCASPERVTRPTKTEEEGIENFEKMREDFNPLALNDDDIEIKESEPTYTDFDDDLLNPRQTVTDSVATGYRVQIIQTTDRQKAKDVQKDAVLRFDEDVYLVFDPPFYKVRVGDFVNWFDAEKLQRLAMRKGFRDAWVVRTKVNLKKAYNWMDEFGQ